MKRTPGSLFYRRPKAVTTDAPRRRWHFPSFLKTIVRRTCLVLGSIVLFAICLGILTSFLVREENKLPESMILVFNITDAIAEGGVSPSLTSPFSRGGITVSEVVSAMDRAANDTRVHGIVVGLDKAGIELVHIQELRAAVKRFRATGKFANIYTSSFGDLGSGVGAYYFASAFEEIWMQPVGFLTLTGIAIDMPFAKDVLDKIGVNPQFLHREEYKTAMENLTNNHMSPENREMMSSILKSISARVFTEIAEDRKIRNDVLQAQFDKGILTDDDALKVGLINHIDYADVMLETMRKKVSSEHDEKEPSLVVFEDYADATMKTSKPRHTPVALVNISGEIVSGYEYEAGRATGDYIAGALTEAADNPDIKVIVVRVDSPGGSPTASETIRRSVVYAKEHGKKVIVSMGPVAASGGYWVSVDADKIYALPATLTGSIGVIMGKFDLSGLWEKLGVNWDSVTWGEKARLWSMNKPMDASDRSALDHAIDNTYAAFIKRVADGRHMKPDAVRAIAKGRAWTGLQAKENGLVDEIGGLDDALDHAAVLAGFKDRSQVDVIVLPEPLSAFEKFRTMLQGQGVFMPNFLSTIIGERLEPTMRTIDTVNRSGPIQVYDPSLRMVKP